MSFTWVRFSCWVLGRVATTSRELQVIEEKRHISSTDFSRSSTFLMYVCMYRDQNAGRSNSMETDNSSIGRVEEFKYLGTKLTNKNSIQEEINVD